MCVCCLHLCIYVCISKEAIWSHQSTVTNGFVSPCGCWELNLAPQEGHPVLLNTESLQPQECQLCLQQIQHDCPDHGVRLWTLKAWLLYSLLFCFWKKKKTPWSKAIYGRKILFVIWSYSSRGRAHNDEDIMAAGKTRKKLKDQIFNFKNKARKATITECNKLGDLHNWHYLLIVRDAGVQENLLKCLFLIPFFPSLPMAAFSTVPSQGTLVSFFINVTTYYDNRNLMEKRFILFDSSRYIVLEGKSWQKELKEDAHITPTVRRTGKWMCVCYPAPYLTCCKEWHFPLLGWSSQLD